MKTKIFLLASLLSVIMIMTACKDNDPVTPNYQEEQLSVYPNPFYEEATIEYMVHESSNVCLSVICCESGTEKTLFEGVQDKGKYYVSMNGTCMEVGDYIAKLKLNDKVIKKVIRKDDERHPDIEP